MIKDSAGTDQAASMVVVVNWLEELKAKLPAKWGDLARVSLDVVLT